MRGVYFLILLALFCAALSSAEAQTNNALSIYEGERINAVGFVFTNEPSDPEYAANIRQKVENTFLIYPQTHYSSFKIAYYLSKINAYPFVEKVEPEVILPGEGGVNLLIHVAFSFDLKQIKRADNLFQNFRSFPVVWLDNRSFLTLHFSASEMVYSNRNAWFATPIPLLAGNPMVDHPAGAGYTAWLEGFGMGGIYGITKVIPSLNFHVYGGASYILSFSTGRELFTDRSRFHGEIEDAFVGCIGGERTLRGHAYSYHLLYGRKQFVLGNGWLIVNTSMNGQERAALQINPRWAAKRLFQADFHRDKLLFQMFQLRPNELPIFNSRTILNGLNLELGNSSLTQIGATLLHVPRSEVKYYTPNGQIYSRDGLWVYNLRLFGNQPANRAGPFYKLEGGYQRNAHFVMRSYAWYTHLGWNFTRTAGAPSVSYRFAYFSGDNPRTTAYERWDALYTGGNGEQWVQGSNMYKIVQNSNEMTHLLQLVYSPVRKLQTVTQLWAFIAPQKNNLGGNPGLPTLESRYYGTELNLTLKYFYSRRWYFHFNTAFTFPGNAIRPVASVASDWWCVMAFLRYTL
ncbi:MAG: alginate export family protein [Odoribacter sp.]